MKIHYLLIILLYFPGFSFPVFSQKQTLKFEYIGAKEGLSHSNVSCILQDSRGFMWFGTRDGLNKYDGYTFTIYKHDAKDENSLSHNTITDIVEDTEGNLWIGTWGGGVNVFNRETEQFTHYKNIADDTSSILADQVNSILKDSEGNLWIGTLNGGLDLYDKRDNTFIHFANDKNDPRSLSENSVKDIYEDSEGNLWVGTVNGGLNLFDRKTKTFTHFIHDDSNNKSLSSNAINIIFEDSRRNLWIGTNDKGLNLFSRETGECTRFKREHFNKNTLTGNIVFSIGEDYLGNLWIGTENGGLSILNPHNLSFDNYQQAVDDNTGPNSTSIWAIYRDTKDNIWIGTFNGGINFISGDANKFSHYQQSSLNNSLSSNKVLCIYEDSKENLWIGTDGGGLNLFDRKTRTFMHFKHEEGNKNSICGNYILKVIEDSQGNLWIGTWADGLTIFNRHDNTFKHYKHDPADPFSLSSNNCWEILEDSDKNIWIGTFGGGLNLYNRKKDNFMHFNYDANKQNEPNNIASNRIRSLSEDSKGQILIGTDGGGLNIFDKMTKQFIVYKHQEGKNSLSSNNVTYTLEDSIGNLWISTDAGLNYFDRKKNHFTTFLMGDGLPNDMILGLLEDGKGNLWISTNKGISRLNLQTRTFKNYTTADGLQSNEFKEEATCRSRSGALYFGGNNGFNEFFPDSIKENAFDPPIVITDFQIFNKRVPIGQKGDASSPLKKHITETKEITLSHEHSVFSLEFASLNYTVPERKQYAYMMEGFDKTWNYIGTKHAATYTNLDPGKYIFKVKGLNNLGDWSDHTAELKLIITPPYWKTWWFYSLVFVLVAGTAFGWFKIRMHSVKKQQKELEQQVAERTSEVVIQKEELQLQSKQVEKLYTEIKDSIRAAHVIQQSILPSESFIREHLPECFIYNKPKDVVSGDFYWFDVVEDKIVIAAVDCTGHGVSGAFMSITGHHLLNQSIYGSDELIASEILDRLNEGVIKALHHQKENEQVQDGMDIAVCVIDKDKKRLQYAGANHPLYLIRDQELLQIKADRFSIGMTLSDKVINFANHRVDLQQGDSLYIFSDGYADQLGGASGEEKFMYPRFRNLLISMANQPMRQQATALEDAFMKWKGATEQLDDILVIGFRL